MSSKRNAKFAGRKELSANEENHKKGNVSSDSSTITLYRKFDEKGKEILSVEKKSVSALDSFPKRKSQKKINEKPKTKKKRRSSAKKSRKKWAKENVIITITESETDGSVLILNESKVLASGNEKDKFEEDKIAEKVQEENNKKVPKKKIVHHYLKKKKMKKRKRMSCLQ